MTYLTAAISMTLSVFEGRLLIAFSYGMFHTQLSQLPRFRLISTSRSFCAIAELLVTTVVKVCAFCMQEFTVVYDVVGATSSGKDACTGVTAARAGVR